jgi:D-alanine-D-alanine ligase
MKIAVLHNLRPDVVPATIPHDSYEEYDTRETISAICAALAELGLDPVPVIADRNLPRRLEDGRFDFAFNIAEGAGRRCREAVTAALCELIGLPYTGSDALTLAAAQDKAMARRIVAADVPVAPGCLIEPGQTDMAELHRLPLPVIVKPNDEGSSKGIGPGAICHSVDAAAKRCQWLAETYAAPALVEQFLSGPEVTVGVRGNGRERQVLGVMEIAPLAEIANESFIYDIDTKRNWRRRVQYHVPARLCETTLSLVKRHALAVADLLGCRDLARIDFRLDELGVPHFIECNPLPGLDPEQSDIVIMCRGSLPYQHLVQGVILEAGRRLGIAIG